MMTEKTNPQDLRTRGISAASIANCFGSTGSVGAAEQRGGRVQDETHLHPVTVLSSTQLGPEGEILPTFFLPPAVQTLWHIILPSNPPSDAGLKVLSSGSESDTIGSDSMMIFVINAFKTVAFGLGQFEEVQEAALRQPQQGGAGGGLEDRSEKPTHGRVRREGQEGGGGGGE